MYKYIYIDIVQMILNLKAIAVIMNYDLHELVMVVQI